MKKYSIFLIIVSLLLVVTACTNDKETKKESQDDQVTEEQTPTSQKEDEKKEETKVEEEKDTNEVDFSEYRPEVGKKKSFTENGEVMFTEEIIAANDTHVQIVVDIGGNKTTQIYRWTKDEIALVFEEKNSEDSSKNVLDTFTEMEKVDVLLSNKGQADWELIDSGAEIEVPFGTYTDVYVLQKVTDEVEDADSIYTKYFAPSMGLVKDVYELTGEYGYTGESNLETVE